MATLRLPAEELERRRRNAEARQKNRGPRQKPYQPRNAGKLKVRKKRPRTAAENADRASREVNVRFPTTELKEQVRAAATRAGLSMSAWIVELIEDTVKFDETIRADRRESS